MVSGPHRKDLGCGSDNIDGFRLHLLAWLPAVHHSNLMLIDLYAALGLGFDLAIAPSAIAIGDESYTNLIAPHQRVQPVRGPVCLYIFSSCDTVEAFPHPFASLRALLTSCISC